MEKIELAYTLNGQKYNLDKVLKQIKIFICQDSSHCLITDNEHNILATIIATCAQNVGFLEVN